MSTRESVLERAIQAIFFQVMRLLPTDLSSTLGAKAVRQNVMLNRPKIVENAKRNLLQHRPGLSEAELDAMVEEFLDGVGRLMAEFAVMHRFFDEGRLEVSGFEAFKAIVGTRPIIAFGLHTGNWETFGPIFQQAGIPLASYFAPPSNAFERKIAENSRARFGVELLSPDARGARDGLRLLKRNRVVMIFPDEARNGRVMGPLYGRPPHDRGNLAVAARLARHSGALFTICHSRRIAPCRFHLDFSAPFELPPVTGSPDLLADVAYLNAAIEPVVLDNIPRWYFLDDDISPFEESGSPVAAGEPGP
jgi:KDO2-lipid IV(A) lauroyltransferase